MEQSKRITAMLLASAIADAMAGPFEGRHTKDSQKFLMDGGWIDRFSPFTPAFQHHWNVYSRNAPAGTFTDDSRLRLLISQAMIKNDKKNSGHRMTKEFLANFVIEQYQIASTAFELAWHIYEDVLNDLYKNMMEQVGREKFLHLWFLWEIAKTATAVVIPKDPPLYSPPAMRITDQEYSAKNWQLERVEPEKITQNIKASYNHDCYKNNEEMPLGLIALLPLSIYFPGDPASAFHYISEIDFFDILDADLYPAVVGAVLADLLGGSNWDEIMDQVAGNGLCTYVKSTNRIALNRLQQDINNALALSREFKTKPDPYSRKNYIQFVTLLHKNFAVGEVMMCTVDEMFSVSLAMMDYAPRNLKQVIEMAVNYGRDNDTVASIAAGFAGASLGTDTIPAEWKQVVETANGIDFEEFGMSLAKIIKK